jgi:hypothetical protein
MGIEAGCGPERRTQVAEQLAGYAKEASLTDQAQQLRDHYLSRLFDVSIYMKELKGRFAQWYNRRHRRYGVLWAERFKSVLVEEGQALSAVAAYIDLNPLRAGLCEDPRDYSRFQSGCSYSFGGSPEGSPATARRDPTRGAFALPHTLFYRRRHPRWPGICARTSRPLQTNRRSFTIHSWLPATRHCRRPDLGAPQSPSPAGQLA